jgi:hypothetical protein
MVSSAELAGAHAGSTSNIALDTTRAETEPEFRALTAKPRAACGDCRATDHEPG